MRPRPELGLDGDPELVFQPAVDLATGRLLGFEALLRWNDPDLGPIPPSVLIPWAEANGHMVDLNAWVLSEACAAAASWQADLQLAVNCSVFQLRQHEAATAAAAAIEESGLNPDRLTIEITETSVTDDGAAADLHAMSRLGIQLTVDDIGSDWSTIESMQQFSIKTMKIDGSLIAGLADTGGVSRAMVETIIHVSHSLGICTVAESVETARQVKILRELGADVGQGYFFAKPLAVEDALMLTTMDPLPVFPLTNLGDDVDDDDDVDDVDDVRDAGAEVDNRYGGDGPDRFEDSTDAMAGGEAGIAAEVIGALDAVSEAGAGSGGGADEFTLTEDMHVEAADLSLVSKKGRLLASFRKGKSA
ncbi:MAG TPA: EAL domain-containing protein [Acidimicrobiales bacterium]|nr:EAL domain-containing protein [Acidimicrobiales bacterium]HLN43089.1 EAL domain-containing protein [Acidimicrobiales bacterium]